jgi:hypothetical protein
MTSNTRRKQRLLIALKMSLITQNFSSEMDEMEHDETFESFEDEVIEENPSLAAQMQKSIASVTSIQES